MKAPPSSFPPSRLQKNVQSPTNTNKLSLGNIPIRSPGDTPTRMAILMWGAAGWGKTTFACTAPGRKLIINVDDDGYVAVAHRTDIIIADYASLSFNDFLRDAKSENPFGLDKVLGENPDITTVIVDSTTSIFYRCLQQAVDEKHGQSNKFQPTMEAPGLTGYGARTAKMIQILAGILRVTGKHNRHVIFISHEATPDLNKDGEITGITLALSDGAVNQTSYRLSEIWYMGWQGGNTRSLAIRPTRLRKPMKTRLFTASQEAEFILHYDADTPDDNQIEWTIKGWYTKWLQGNKQKLPLPKLKKKT